MEADCQATAAGNAENSIIANSVAQTIPAENTGNSFMVNLLPVQAATAGNTGNSITANSIVQATPAGNTENSIIANSIAQSTPEENTENSIIANSIDQSTPAENTGNSIIANSIAQSTPARDTGHSILGNQHQETLNVESEMPTIAKQATNLKRPKITKNSNQKKVPKIMENKDGQKSATAMKKSNDEIVHKNLKNKDEKVVLSQAEKEVLTAIYLLNDPNGSSEAEIMNFMLSQHIQHGSFPAFFDGMYGGRSARSNVNDTVNRGISTKSDGKYKRPERRDTSKR